jgi:hypothetical protein
MEEELRQADLLPTQGAAAVDIEAFIENHLKATLDQYAPLEMDVLGFTEFKPGGHPAVRINGDLTGSAVDAEWCPPGVKGRWRATLAHEAAHIVLHRILFESDSSRAVLFELEETSTGSLLRCLKRDLGYQTRVSDWREVQANQGMAALLMPKTVFVVTARREVGDWSKDAIRSGTRRLATMFEVSREATEIRLRNLGFRAADGTLITPN